MFGTYRYILSMMVVFTHLWPHFFSTREHWTGPYAVYSFYMLSGFLMTLILNDRYGFSGEGIVKYLINRALRIYPPYLAVVALTVLVVNLNPFVAYITEGHLQMPGTVSQWTVNLSIIGLHEKVPAKFVPPAWSLNVELFFYLAMAFVLSRRRIFVILWVIFSFLYTSYMVANGWMWEYRYFPYQAASLSFSLGALIYYIKDRFAFRKPAWILLFAPLLFFFNAFFSNLMGIDMFLWGFYASISLNFIVILSLLNIGNLNVPPALRKIDRFLGDLSYPIFLCHWLVAVIVVWAGFSGIEPNEKKLFLVCLPFINILAYLIHRLVEARVNSLRTRIKKSVSFS